MLPVSWPTWLGDLVAYSVACIMRGLRHREESHQQSLPARHCIPVSELSTDVQPAVPPLCQSYKQPAQVLCINPALHPAVLRANNHAVQLLEPRAT